MSCCVGRPMRRRHQTLGDDPLGVKPRHGPVGERGHGVRLLIVEELPVDQSGVVIDDRVEVVVAELSRPVVSRSASIASDRVSGPAEPGIALDVHVQQVPGAWQLHTGGPAHARPWGLWRCRAGAGSRGRWSAPPRVCPAISLGPQPERRRSSQTRRSISVGVRFGERCGRLERSSAQLPASRSCALATRNRCFQ